MKGLSIVSCHATYPVYHTVATATSNSRCVSSAACDCSAQQAAVDMISCSQAALTLCDGGQAGQQQRDVRQLYLVTKCSTCSAIPGTHLCICSFVVPSPQVRTQTLVKNAIIQIDAAPFKQWYQQHYGVELGQKKGEEKAADAEEKKVSFGCVPAASYWLM